jgi:hypothetical protein
VKSNGAIKQQEALSAILRKHFYGMEYLYNPMVPSGEWLLHDLASMAPTVCDAALRANPPPPI